MWTVQRGHLFFRPLIKKFALFHCLSSSLVCLLNYYSFPAHKLWQDVSDGEEEAQAKEVQRGQNSEGKGASADRHDSRIARRPRRKK
jgi:hypothetical protein